MSTLIDQRGNTSVIVDPRGRNFALHQTNHYGADMAGTEIAGWVPGLTSADGEFLEERELLLARTHDLIRNHGLISGAVQTHLDNVIGTNLRLSAKPDWKALGLSAEWAREWQGEVEAQWRQWAEDIDCNCDASRRLTFGGMVAQAYRSFLTSFEILATAEWLPRRRYATSIQMIDPGRLCNPWDQPDGERMRGGIEFDAMGAPIAYHIASNLRDDPYYLQGHRTWKRVPRETPWGRALVVHVYDAERPGQSRGKGGIVSVLAKSKMLEKFEGVTLQAAILNAMYAAVIESPMDWETVGQALGVPHANDPTTTYMSQRAQFHRNGAIRYNGIKIPHLFPGEKLELKQPQHPNAAFASFEEATLRHLAGGLNLSYEQLSRDYSKTNYSSARAAMLEAWRFFKGRRHAIAGRFARQVYALWLEEAIQRGDVEIPAGAPSFYEAKTAWTSCRWIGPGQGHIDPQKETAAIETKLRMNLTTLEEECAAQGLDWEEVIEQRALELQIMRDKGLVEQPSPATTGEAEQDPQDPESDPATSEDTEE